MARKELVLRVGLALGINLLLVPIAMVVISGHFGGDLNPVILIVVFICVLFFLLPSIIALLLVEAWAGQIAGGIAFVIVQLGWVYLLVSCIRQWQIRRQNAVEAVAR